MLADFADYDPSVPSKYDQITQIPNLVNNSPLENTVFIAPYVPVDRTVCAAAIKLARLTKSDTLIDLGCGDGRILNMALESPTPPRSVVGVEYDELLVGYIKTTHPSIKIIHADLFEIDLRVLEITVVILYLFPAGLTKLEPKLFKFLGGGGRVVTIGYSLTFRAAKVVGVRPMTSFMGGANQDVQKLYYYDHSSI